MPGFSSYDDLINELTTNGKALDWDFFKIGQTMQGAGVWHSLWDRSGSPGAGANPAGTPGSAHDNLAGSMNWAAASPDFKHLLTLGAAATQACVLMLYDRLVGVGAVSLATTGAKTVSSAALDRYTTGAGVQVWLEVTTATTTTAPVVAMNSYTDQAGNTGHAGGNITFPAAATVAMSLVGPMPLAAGDSGVRAVSTINVVTAAAAGAVNVLLIKPLAFLPVFANQWNERDLVLQLAGLPRVFDNASLGLAVLPGATTALNLWGKVRLGYG